MIPTVAANGSPAFGQYKPAEDGDGYEPWALQVLEIEDGRIVEITFFLDTENVFPLFGLPEQPPAALSARPAGTRRAPRTRRARAARARRGADRPADVGAAL